MATTTLIGDSEFPVLSANGRFIVFRNYFYPGLNQDTNGSFDIFVQDLVANLVYPISLSSKEVWGNFSSSEPVISANGRFIVFASDATNLVPGDTNGERDLFRRDRVTGTTTRISLDSKGNQVPANTSFSYYSPSISANGRFVAFQSDAQLTGDPRFDSEGNIFVRDVKAGTTTIVSVNSSGVQGDSDSSNPSISANGRFVAFQSLARNLVTRDKNIDFDVFVHDRLKKTTIRASVNSQGQKGSGFSDYESPLSSDAFDPVMSPNGRYVVFESSFTNLVPNDTNEVTDIFRHDLQTRTTTRISVNSKGKQANGGSAIGFVSSSAISADGRYVVFQSVANNLVPGDTNNALDVFLRDVVVGITTRVSVNSKGEEPVAGFLGTESYDGTISADGRKIVFISNGRNMNDAAIDTPRIYLRDLGPNRLQGTGGKDTLTGSSKDNLLEAKGGNDILLGRSGNDRLVGGDGDDLLIGETGRDRLIGGNGKDSFRLTSRGDVSDIITDFRKGWDTIEILADRFGAGLKAGQSIAASQFVLGSSATKDSHRFIFSSDSNTLFFDPDGEDAKGKVKLATLSNDPTLSRSDIVLV